MDSGQVACDDIFRSVFLWMPPDRTDGTLCPVSRKKGQTAGSHGRLQRKMPLSVFCPETDRSRIRGQDFSGSNRKYPDMFSVFSSCRNPCRDSVDSVDSFFRSGSAFFQNRTADNASSRTTAGLPDASLAGSERICLNRLAPGRPVIMPSMWRVIPCIFRPFSP